MKVDIWNQQAAYYDTIDVGVDDEVAINERLRCLSEQLGFELSYSFDVDTVILDFVD